MIQVGILQTARLRCKHITVLGGSEEGLTEAAESDNPDPGRNAKRRMLDGACCLADENKILISSFIRNS